MTPGGRVRLAAFAVLLTLLGIPAVGRAKPFADVPADAWAYQAIQMLAADGVVDGYPDGAFRGDRPLSRDEMAAIVARVIAKIDVEGAQTASDADLDTLRKLTAVRGDELDALGARVSALEDRLAARGKRAAFARSISAHGTNPTIQALAAGGLIDGYPGGAFEGERPLTRYEMAAIVARVIAKIETEGARTASKADLDTLQKLTGVLGDELDALGVRVTALEDRLAALGKRAAFARLLSAHGTLDGLIDGSSDGAFECRRPLSRDETAAIVARVIAKIAAEGAQTASKADLDALQKLTGVFAGELDALGVRVTALEDRLAALDAAGGVRGST